MSAVGSARRSNVVRKYGHDATRGLIGGKAGQRLGYINLRGVAAPPKPPKVKKPQPQASPERQLRRLSHDPNRPPPTCQYKASFDTWAEAETEAIKRMGWHRNSGLLLVAYLCDRCGSWHNRRTTARSLF